jgi:hypothetical protein
MRKAPGSQNKPAGSSEDPHKKEPHTLSLLEKLLPVIHIPSLPDDLPEN